MILSEDFFEEVPIPDVVTDIEVTPEISGPEPGPDMGIASLLIEAIQAEWKMVDLYNSIIATIADVDPNPEFFDVLSSIVGEENIHIGQLQSILGIVSPNAANITQGEQEVID